MKAVNVEIEGELKGTADFKWEVDRGRTEMVLLALTLNPGTMANLLASLFRGTGKSPRPVDEENVDRLNATIVGVANQDLKVTYRLTLKDLQFSDKNSAFFLRALFESSISGSTVNSGAAVTLITVHGSYFFFTYF